MKFEKIERRIGAEPRVPVLVLKIVDVFTDVALTRWPWKPESIAIFTGLRYPAPRWEPEFRNRTSNLYELDKDGLKSLSGRFNAGELTPIEQAQGWTQAELNKAADAMGIKFG